MQFLKIFFKIFFTWKFTLLKSALNISIFTNSKYEVFFLTKILVIFRIQGIVS